MTGESAALFEGLFLQAPIAAVLSRLEDGQILAVNDAWVELMGIARERAVGHTANSLGIWRSTEQRNEALREFADGSGLQHVCVLPGQTAKTLRMNSKVLLQTSPRLLLTYLTDITREVAAEQALRASHLELQRRVELHSATERLGRLGHWTNPTDDDRVIWSHGLYDIAGIARGEALQRRHGREGIHPDDMPAWLAAREAKDGREVAFRWTRPDGQQRWFRTRIGQTAVADNSQADFGVVQDVTVEHEARQAQADQLQMLENIAARVPGVMFKASLSVKGVGTFLYVSQAAHELLELDPKAVQGHARAFFERVHPDDSSQIETRWLAAGRALEPLQNEFRVQLPKRGLRWLRVEALPQQHPDGGTIWHGYASDITEIRLAEQSMQRQHRMLEAVRQALAAFIDSQDQQQSFEQLLEAFLTVTASTGGFVGEVLYDEQERPYAKMQAITQLSWDANSSHGHAHHAESGTEFHRLDTLFGQAMATGQVVVASQPDQDDSEGGQAPKRHFLGVPVSAGDRLVALVGLCSQSGGYSDADVEFLQPLLGTVRQLVLARRSSQERDLSRQRLQHAGTMLAEKSQALQLTLDSMGQGLVLMDAEGRIRVFNRRFQELLDLPDSLMAQYPTHNEVVAFQTARGDLGEGLQLLDPSLRPFLNYQPEQRPPEVYLRATHLGTTIEVTTRILPEGGWVRTYTDMTSYVKAQQALDAERQRLAWVLEATRCGTWETNLVTEETHINDQWAGQLGYTVDEIGPATMSTWRSMVHPQDVAYAEHMLRRHWRGETDYYDVDFRMRHKDGHWMWINDRGRVHQRDENGRALFMSGTHIDIHDRVQAQEEARQLNTELERRVAERTAELERSMKDMEAISYSIAHDLRAPLRSVNGFSALIEEEGADQLSPSAREMFARINRSSRNMGQMITDMLELLRVVRVDLDAVPVDMEALSRVVVDQLGAELPGASISIGTLPKVMGDATLLRQVLLNLIDNALKYSRHRQVPQVSLSFDSAIGAFCLRDNGMGFDMAHAGKLFGLFQRMHTGADVPGTGVGLAIVSRIIERHGGLIWAESAPDQGTSFWWTLPTE